MKTVLEARIDKYLWAVRLFKTRALAADACKTNKVLMNGAPVKTSRMVKAGDVFQLKRNPVLFRFRVKQVIENRVSASLVVEVVENITPPDELEKLAIQQMMAKQGRDNGAGRPTKKDRREIDSLHQGGAVSSKDEGFDWDSWFNGGGDDDDE